MGDLIFPIIFNNTPGNHADGTLVYFVSPGHIRTVRDAIKRNCKAADMAIHISLYN